MRTSRRIPALLALAILIAFAALLSLSDTTAAQTIIDYDTDDDGYIEVSNHGQLDSIRLDLNGDGAVASTDSSSYGNDFPNRDDNAATRMGCPSGNCVGYELTANIDLTTYSNWVPIGTNANKFTGDFKGNGYEVQNLTINNSSLNDVGLFGNADTASRIESVGVTNANVTGANYTGILVGVNRATVVGCYTTGAVTGTNWVGGLVGWTGTPVTSSYSTAAVTGVARVGGLVGTKAAAGSITDSYSTGAVTRSSGTATTIGGLVGESTSGTGAVTTSYYDSTTSGCVSGGSNGCTTSAAGTTQTTSALQTPVGYTGIYSTWNANIDGVAGNDDPWDFGTTSDYPTLKYGKLTDYDADNDGYIDIANLAQLDAIRHDLNGNGDSTNNAYIAAFPNRITFTTKRMGCPGTCTGYELTASLDFDSDSDGDVDANDHSGAYWDSGSGWNPISTYTSTFKGNGHTINNLFISRASISNVGLFGTTNGARIETLGVTNANVRGSSDTGILIGHMNRGNLVACYTSGKVRGGGQTGGLVGYSGFNGGAINSSYSTAYVRGGQYVGGLVGFGTNGSITNSYSTGRVDGSSDVGGLLGRSHANHTQSASYWDTSASGRSNGIGTVSTGALPGSSAGVTGKTTRELQTPTGYNGIYANWNTNLDGVTGNDDPWTFGSKTQYPMLDYKSMSVNPQGGQAMGRSHNWNAPIVGELVSVRLTAAAFPNRSGKWIWERSDNGDTWETISGSRSPTYEYAPTTSDVNHFLRAKVELNDGTFAYTRNLGGRVKNASVAADATQGSAVSFVSGNASPRVGTAIVAGNPAPTDAVDARFAWQRCPNATTPHTDCVYIPEDSWCEFYTPVAADVGNYLRMYVYYATSAGVWTRHETGFTGQVAASQ